MATVLVHRPVIRASGFLTIKLHHCPVGLSSAGGLRKAQRMSPRASEAKLSAAAPRRQLATGPSIADLILVRIASEGGATRNMVTRDLALYTANKLSPAEWRQTADRAIEDLSKAGLTTEKRGRLQANEAGIKRSGLFLALGADAQEPWQVHRDISLIAKAVGIDKLTGLKRKALVKPDGLRTLIVQHSFGLSAKMSQTPATLRAALAVIALQRAFGKKIKSGLGDKANFPAKASRLLAGQLLDPAREFSTDAQLIAHIAADKVGARQTSLEDLRQALICKLTNALLEEKPDPKPVTKRKAPAKKSSLRKTSNVTLAADNDTIPSPIPKTADGLPDIPQFSRIVNGVASSCAEGWPGNMKAFISRVWQAIRDGHQDWNLSEDTFKSMLVDAHRSGSVVLTGADLKNKTDLEDFEKSATQYKNTVWHFIRIDA